jgi:hypothetical protein
MTVMSHELVQIRQAEAQARAAKARLAKSAKAVR